MTKVEACDDSLPRCQVRYRSPPVISDDSFEGSVRSDSTVPIC